MSTACTYDPRHQAYSCDPKFSTAVLKGAVEHVLENAIASTNEYFSRRIMPLYEAYPSMTVIVALVIGCSVTWRYRWFLMKIWALAIGAAILHTCTRDRA